MRNAVSFGLISLLLAVLTFSIGFYSYASMLGYLAYLFLMVASILLVLRSVISERKREFHIQTNRQFWQSKMGDSKRYFAKTLVVGIILLSICFSYLFFRNGISNIFPAPNKHLILDNYFLPYSPIFGFAAGNQRLSIISVLFLWPFMLPLSIITTEKISLFLIFFIIYILSVSVARRVYSSLEIQRLSETEFGIIFALLMMFNFVLLADEFFFAIGSILFTYVIIVLYDLFRSYEANAKNLLRIIFVLSTLLFIDPRWIIYFYIIIIPLVAISVFRGRLWHFILHITIITLSLIPFILILYMMMNFTGSGSALLPAFDGSFNQIAQFSQNTNAIDLWFMLGNWWPSLIFTSPSLLFLHNFPVSSLQTYGFNVSIVLFPGILQIFWLALTSYSAILFATSILFLSKGKLKSKELIYLLPSYFLLFSIVLGTNLNFLPFLQLEIYLESVPILGSYWALTISTPNWIEPALVSLQVVFISYSISEIGDKIFIHKLEQVNLTKNYKSKSIVKNHSNIKNKNTILIFVLVFVILFSGWQFLFQEYSLGQTDPGLTGNKIATTSPYFLANPPNNWLFEYNKIASSSNYSYAVYSNDVWYEPTTWDKGISSLPPPGQQPPPLFVSLLSTITNDNYSNLVLPLFNLFGVKYYFFDRSLINYNKTQYNFLSNSKLVVYYRNPNLTIFEDPNASIAKSGNNTLNICNINTLSSLEVFGLLNKIFVNPILSAGETSGSISIINYTSKNQNRNNVFFANSSDLANYSFYNSITGFGNKNLSGVVLPGTSNLFNEWYMWNFLTSRKIDWTLVNNTLTIEGNNTNAKNISFGLYYMYPLISGVNDIKIPCQGETSVVASLNFKYRSQGLNASILAGIHASNERLQNDFQDYKQLAISSNWTEARVSFVIPLGSSTFNFGIQFSGTEVQLKDVRFSYSFLTRNEYLISNSSTLLPAVFGGNENFTSIIEGTNLNGQFVTSDFLINSNFNLSLTLKRNFESIFTLLISSVSTIDSLTTERINSIKYFGQNATYSFFQKNSYRYFEFGSWENNSIRIENARLTGNNKLGQSIFEIINSNIIKITISINGYTEELYYEVLLILLLDLAFPVSIFIIPKFRKRS